MDSPIGIPLDSLFERYDPQPPRYTSYPAVPAWSGQIGPSHHLEQLLDASRRSEPLSIYVHVPFCRSLCSYCGCNVVVTRQRKDAERYIDWISAEAAHVARLLGGCRSVAQLHWGGGTPNFLDEEQLTRLWIGVFDRFRLSRGAEVAVEVNPATCQLRQLERMAALGFNRISFGVQDLDPGVQRAVRRAPVARRLRELVDAARALGFGGVNFDLIYGLPGQTAESWARTLDSVLRLAPDRLAVYAFSFLPEALPHQRVLNAEALPRGREKLDLFRLAYATVVRAGYRPIGMDHFALPDDELARAQSRHVLRRNFQGYTASQATDVIGLGASAISDVDGLYAQNARDLKVYEEAIQAGDLATRKGIRLSSEDRRRRKIIHDLMCNFWTDLGPDGPTSFEPELERLRDFERDGLVAVRGSEVTVTPVGHFFVRNVAQVFDAYFRPTSTATAAVS